MDKGDLYRKTEQVLNQAFEVAKQSVKALSEKAGEAAHVTGLLLEKATLEHRVGKKFAELGHRVYTKAMREGKSLAISDAEIKEILKDTQKLETELAEVEATIERERRQKKEKRPGAKVRV
jgi:hypothetical protein